MSFRLFGIVIERKTDVLAFAAFLISIGSLTAQFVNLVRGPDIVVEGPKLVTFYSDRATDNKQYLRVFAGFTYLNTGSPGYDDILKSERADVLVDDVVISLQAKNYIETSSDPNNKKNMTLKIVDDALPIALKSGAVLSHETEFMSFPGQNLRDGVNFSEMDPFLGLLAASSSLVVRFTVETYEGQVIVRECVLKAGKVHHYLNVQDKSINARPSPWSTSYCR